MRGEDKKFIIALSSSRLIGPKSLSLIKEIGPKKVWDKGSAIIGSGLPMRIFKEIDRVRNSTDIDAYLKRLEKLGIGVKILGDKDYPGLLSQISDPPVVLYYKGSMPDGKMISVVGSRKCSHYAVQAAEKIIPDLLEAGLVVVSGMALGVDTFAHKVALKSGGKTVAVLGSGLDIIYPSFNNKLFEDITQNGAVISEFPLGTPPLRQNFPQRNRIVAGLAESTIIMEANLKSGSLITAKFALDFNRQVYAVPGDITRQGSAGVNNLIKLGAKPVTEPADILSDYGISLISHLGYLPKTDAERKIYEALEESPLHVDKICENTGLSAIEISQNLVMLEIQGVIINLGNSTYIRK